MLSARQRKRKYETSLLNRSDQNVPSQRMVKPLPIYPSLVTITISVSDYVLIILLQSHVRLFAVASLLDVLLHHLIDLILVEVKLGEFAPDALLGREGGHECPRRGRRLQVVMVIYAQNHLANTLFRQVLQFRVHIWSGLRRKPRSDWNDPERGPATDTHFFDCYTSCHVLDALNRLHVPLPEHLAA